MNVEAKKRPGNALAITALVLASMFFLPLIPFFGLVLGIVAIATGRSKPMSIVAICLGGFFTLMSGVYAAIAIPAFMAYMSQAKASEAKTNTRVLADAISALPAIEWAKLAESDWTPSGSACAAPNHKFPADESAFAGEPWRTLQFQVAGPHYYQYRIGRNNHGFVVEARGDLDCDGKFSHFARSVAADGVAPLTSEDALE